MAKPFIPDGDNCSVDGYRPRPGGYVWRGLDWSQAVWREQSSLMLFLVGQANAPIDEHWSVPHPELGSVHRVRKERRRRKPMFAGAAPICPGPLAPPSPEGDR